MHEVARSGAAKALTARVKKRPKMGHRNRKNIRYIMYIYG